MAGRQRPWVWPEELHEAGILGMNRRNLMYILEANPRKLYPRVDNKLLTKQICQQNQIPIPETYLVIQRHGDARRFGELIANRQEFVIKPSSGAAGRGIIVIARREGEDFETPSGRRINTGEIRYHLSTILSGLYSLGGQPDVAIVEQRIVMHPAFANIAVGGTPDVRIIIYRGVPLMAMARLPTKESGGRANLHQGAVAAAIHLETGQTFGGVLKDRAVTHHPDTQATIDGFAIPGWPDLMDAAIRLGDALELGYMGVDFVVDAARGPVVLEANARPGLAIQVANRIGLLRRLDFVDSQPAEFRRGEERRRLIRELTEIQ